MKNRLPILSLLLLAMLCCISNIGFSQVNPTDSLPGDPGAMSVYTVQNLSFGTFTPGASGGTVTISNTGVRSVTGTIIPLNLGLSWFQSIFDIDAPEGSIISIMNGPDAVLTGSNGGTMTLELGSSLPNSPFATVAAQPVQTQVSIGGKLTVGNSTASPPGTYSGTFYITFNQE